MEVREILPQNGHRIADRSQRSSATKEGSLSNPRILHNQHYSSLLRSCAQRRCLFEDPIFPADQTSIGECRVNGGQWRRPHEIHRNPQFFVKGVNRFDLCQGAVGDCWFLAALASLTMRKDLFAHIVPHNQDFQRNYWGIFHFRFWYFGDWVDVVVDDRLPTNGKGQLIFVRSCDSNEFWCALLEKAYAKLYGSYGDLQMGNISDALVDFTGGIKSRILLENAPSDLWMRMKRTLDLGSFMGCSTQSEGAREQTLLNGLVLTHAYTVTGAEEVPYENGMEQLVRIRNPWGNDVEWNQRWSDGSPEWNRIDPRIKDNLLINREDGEFWMAMQDFKINFKSLVICDLTPDFLKGADGQKWALSVHHGSWRKGHSAGGPMDNKELFGTNPQYCLTLTEKDMDKETKSFPFIVCLLQKPTSHQRNKSPIIPITCFLFKFQVQNEKLPQTLLDQRYLVKKTAFHVARELSETYQLGPGTYVLVPFTYYPNQEKDFLLRAYFQRGSCQNNASFNHNLHHPPEPISFLPRQPRNRDYNSSWEQIFNKYAQTLQARPSTSRFSRFNSWSPPLSPSPLSPTRMESWKSQAHRQHSSWSEVFPLSPTSPITPISPAAQNAEINAAALQRILNEVFLGDQETLEDFSLNSCRGIVLLMDPSGTRRLDRHNFRRLWEKLMHFKEVFHKNDVEGTGVLRPSQLSNSLQDDGLEVTKSALKLMVLRYGDSSGRISLESFINCFLRLEFAIEKYAELSKGGPGIYLSAAEWMLVTTYF
ncbi:calpain-14-like [Mustelus asterias]